MKLSRDLIAGVASSIWSALVGLAVVPVYIRYVGLESYGLIGFFATLQAMLQLLDLGLSATVNREVARHFATGTLSRSADLIRTLAVLYWGTAFAIAILAIALGPVLARHWLDARHISMHSLETSVVLLGFVIACRWPIGLYQGVLLGAHRLTTTSLVNIIATTLSSLGAVFVLANVSARIEAFFIWQCLVGLVTANTMRMLAWHEIGKRAAAHFDTAELKRVWRITAGMSGVAITGMMLMQTDKVVLSKLLELEAFGRYTLAALVASGLYLILTPTFNLVFPRLSALVVRADEALLIAYYRRGTRLLGAALFPMAAVVVFFADDILFLWTGNAAIAKEAAPLVRWFLVGTTLNGIMHFPYALQLASGQTKTPVIINTILLAIMLPSTTILAIRFGAVGGAASWALLNVFYVVIGTWLTHQTLLRGIGLRWLGLDVAAPLLVCAVSLGTLFFWIERLELSAISSISAGVVGALAAGALLLAAERMHFKDTAPSFPN